MATSVTSTGAAARGDECERLLSTLIACPTTRCRSAWIGVAVNSSQSVFFAILILTLVG